MKTYLRVLSDEDQNKVHESSLKILADTGVRVDSAIGREFLLNAGAEVHPTTDIVKFPRRLVEEALRLVTRDFNLGARRPAWSLQMNTHDCSLIADGEGTSIIDKGTNQFRETTFQDWLDATRLIDAIDEIGVYWTMAHGAEGTGSIPDMVRYWHNLFKNYSKHVQDSLGDPSLIPWFLEVLQIIFGDQKTIKQSHPFSYLICPQSPLVIDQQYTDCYFGLLDWDIPVAIMPMPLMGGTAPGNMISTVILGNCETLAMLTLIQAAAPGTPVIYAPVLAVMNPRTGLYSGGAIENAVMSSAAIEMARYYGLPAEGTGGGTDNYLPGIQTGYERALTSVIPMLSWPDLFVGPGLLGGSMVLSLEQIIIDIEIFRMNRQAHRGIPTEDEKWLEDVIRKVGPAGNYLGEKSTIQGIRSGNWLVNRLGVHQPLKTWEQAGRPGVLDEAREKVDHILKTHTPLPFNPEVEKELQRVHDRAVRLQDG